MSRMSELDAELRAAGIDPEEVDLEKLCDRCHKRPAEPLHECPYQMDVNNDPDPEWCNCCDKCRQECADDI